MKRAIFLALLSLATTSAFAQTPSAPPLTLAQNQPPDAVPPDGPAPGGPRPGRIGAHHRLRLRPTVPTDAPKVRRRHLRRRAHSSDLPRRRTALPSPR